jgi:photosystem II stability/assembly factor-like uncharacterized protein
MVTPLSGWGSDEVDVLHTTDGGRHWQVVTPPIPWLRGYSTGYLPLDVIDARTAWLEVPNSLGSRPATAASIFHTTDAGKSWKRLPVLRLGQFGSVANLQFVDLRHGWMIVIRNVGMSQISFDIYRTVDGGVRWRRTLEEEGFSGNHHHIGGGLPDLDLGQSYTFSSPTAGWVAGCFCGFGSIPELFFHSTDGGHFWRPYRLPLPRAYRPGNASVGAPTFFSRSVADLPVYLLPRRGGRVFDLYHTTDGGRTWHGATPIRVRADVNRNGFVDALHGFVLDNRFLYRTSDGGQHWQARPFTFSRPDLIALDFVRPTVGFALEEIGASNRSRLFKTTDGGRTWHPISSPGANFLKHPDPHPPHVPAVAQFIALTSSSFRRLVAPP